MDGGGNYISRDIRSAPDAYTKSIHNLMGLVTGALPTGKKAGVALTDGCLSAMPGTDVNGPTALVDVGGEEHGSHQVHRDAHEHEAPARTSSRPARAGRTC